MTNLEYLISKLGNSVFSFSQNSADINRDTGFEFLDDQKELKPNIVYIAPASSLEKRLETCTITPGSILFVSGAKENLPDIKADDYTLIICSCHPARLFNLCNRTLKELFSIHTPVASRDRNSCEEKASQLWEKIRSKYITSSDDIKKEWTAIYGDLIKDYFRISVISPDNRYSVPLVSNAVKELKSLISDGIIFPIGTYYDEFVVIQFFDRQPFYEFENQAKADKILTEFNMHMTIGNGTTNYGDMNTVFRLYYRANYLAHQLQLQPYTHVYYYENYAMFNIIDLSSQRFIELFGNSDMIYLIDPSVMHIMDYDKKHNTNLKEVLFAYLTYNCDIKATAERLYMHRNTVSNKLNLIKTICPINYDNGLSNQRIVFSCQVISYYEKVMKMNFKTKPE